MAPPNWGLLSAQPEAFVEVHSKDAEKLGLEQGDMVRITSRRGEVVVRAKVIDIPREGMLFVPMHWPDENSLINKVTINAFDPGSKQPEFKICLRIVCVATSVTPAMKPISRMKSTPPVAANATSPKRARALRTEGAEETFRPTTRLH